MRFQFNAFRAHDQDGLPLSVQADYVKGTDIRINYYAFACDALFAGWPEERARAAIMEARPELDWADFRQKLSALWTAAGCLRDPECWPAMKEELMKRNDPAHWECVISAP